jgi:hypothetical protein
LADVAGTDPQDDRVPFRPDLKAAVAFMTMMAEGEPVTWQTFDDGPKKRRDLAQVLHGDLEDCAGVLQTLNRRGAGVFWQVNYGDRAGRRAENITGIRALFLDLDGTPLEPVLAAGVEPHAVVESSPGKYHVYFQVTGCALDQLRISEERDRPFRHRDRRIRERDRSFR